MSKTDRHLEFYERLANSVIAEHGDAAAPVYGNLATVIAKLLLEEIGQIRETLAAGRYMSPGDWMELGGSLHWYCTEIGRHINSPQEFAKWEKRMERHRQSTIGRGPRNRLAPAQAVLKLSGANNWNEFVEFVGNEYDFEELGIAATACKSHDGQIDRYKLYNYQTDRENTISRASIGALRSRIKKGK